MTITVADPSGASVDFPDGTDASVIHDVMTKHFGASEPVTANKVARSAASGVPIVGGLLNKLDAATNATLAPAVEPFLTPSDQDISRHGETWSERYAKSEAMQNAGDKRFGEQHPYIDTGAKIAGGIAGTIPAMTAAPAAFGLTGTLPQMVARGAASNAALSGADAAIRGEDPTTAAAVGGAVGAAAPLVARGVGALARGIKDYRNPPPVVPQNVEKVAGVDVPLTTGQATLDPRIQSEEEVMRKGGRGQSAEEIARQADAAAQQAVAEASGNISKSMDPTGASTTTAPQAAGGAIQAELAAREQAKQAAAQAEALRVQNEGESVARGLGSGPPASAPINWDRNTVANGLPLFGQQRVMDVPVDAMEGAFKAGNPNMYVEKPNAAVIAHADAGKPMSIPEISATNGRLAFTNGRNRFALAKQNGDKTIPVAVDDGNQAEVTALMAKHAPPVVPPASALDTAEGTGAAVAAKAAQAKATAQAAYKARDAVPGTFDESVPKGLAEDIRSRLNTGENPLWVDPTNESTANKALKLIDQTLGKDSGIFANSAAPKPPPIPKDVRPVPVSAPAVAEDETTAALRAKYGDEVANAYVKQGAKGGAGPAAKSPLSLLQFIASKGGLKPHPELEAIGLANGHRAQIPGQSGFFGVVGKNGYDIDRMREAAQEAGYFRSGEHATSTPAEFLDAIEAELRGQKRYPEGFEGHKTRQETVARGAAEQHADSAINRGFEDDLKAAGHGDLGPDVRDRAVKLMRDEGMHPDEAVDHALAQLDQEDAAAAPAAAAAKSSFPGDLTAPAVAQPAARPVDLKTIDEARKRLSTMFGDAKAAAIRSGDRSDMRAMGKILHEFDNSIGDALESGKFSGDAKLAKKLQDEARAAHAEYRQTFSSRGPGDEVGRSVEKILGRYTDSAASPDEIAAMSYGPKGEPGGGKAERVAIRLKKIIGDQSPEWGRYKQGLFAHVIGDDSLSPAEKAARIDKFLTGRGRGLANVALEPAEKRALASYSTSLKGIEPAAKPTDRVGKALQRITGADGHPPATSNEVVNTLFSRSAKGDGLSTELAAYLKKNLSPASWSALKQGAFEHLVATPEGAKDLTSNGIAKRLSAYLDGDLSKVLNTPEELAEMRKLMLVHNKLTPLPGTTNPSGSAFFGQKMLRGAGKNLMTMLGFAHGGLGGAVVGHGLDAVGGMVKDARAGKQATQLFFGKQAKTPIVTGRLPQLLAPTVAQRAQGGAQ